MEHVIRVNRSSSGGHPSNSGQVVSKTEDKSGNITGMQHQMEEELERRRKDWEKEVEKMQEDFFNVKLPKSNNKVNANKTIEIQGPAGGMTATSRTASKGMDILEIGNAKAIFTEAKDGSKMVKFNFDVRGFDPNAITVRAEGSKLCVSAEYEQECFPGSKNTRRHNRQVDIPNGVDPDLFVSRLSADGFLSVEAPVTEEDEDPDEEEEPLQVHVIDNSFLHGQPGLEFDEYTRMPSSSVTYNSYTPQRTERIITSSSSRNKDGGRKKMERPNVVVRESSTNAKPIIVYRSSTSDLLPSEHQTSPLASKQFDYGDRNIVSTEEGHRLKILVTLGTVYKPEEITVELLYKKIIVKAVHEEVIAGRSSKSEFSREFDIPGPVEPRTFKAVLSGDGKLSIGGSLAENKNHDAVMSLVFCDMPIKGRAVKVINH